MNGKFAWPSVAVYRGGTFSRRSIIKCDTDENFGALMERLEVNLGSETAAIYDSSSDSDQHIRGDYRLHNDFIHYLETKKVGWSPSTVSTTGEQFVKTLVSALWCLDSHHRQFIDYNCMPKLLLYRPC